MLEGIKCLCAFIVFCELSSWNGGKAVFGNYEIFVPVVGYIAVALLPGIEISIYYINWLMNTLSHVYSYSNVGMLDILALLYIVNAYVY